MEKREKDKRQRSRRLKVGVALAAPFILALLSMFFLQTRPFSSWLLGRINRNLKLQFGLKVEAASLKINPWRFSLEARDVRLILLEATPASPNSDPMSERQQGMAPEEAWAFFPPTRQPPSSPADRPQPHLETRRQSELLEMGNASLLSIRKVLVNLSSFPLLRHCLRFQEILIDEPVFTFRQLAPLKARLGRFPTQRERPLDQNKFTETDGQKTKRWQLRVDHLQIATGRLVVSEYFSSMGGFQSISLDKVEAGLSFDKVEMEHRGWLKLGEGKVAFAGQAPFALTSISLYFRFNEMELSFDQVLLENEALSLKGEAKFQIQPRFLLTGAFAAGEMRVDKILTPGMPFQTKGRVNFELSLAEDNGKWAGRGHIRGEDMAFAQLAVAPLRSQLGFRLPLISGKPDFGQLEADFCLDLSEEEKGPGNSLEGREESTGLPFSEPGTNFLLLDQGNPDHRGEAIRGAVVDFCGGREASPAGKKDKGREKEEKQGDVERNQRKNQDKNMDIALPQEKSAVKPSEAERRKTSETPQPDNSRPGIETVTGRVKGTYKNREFHLAEFSLTWAGIDFSASAHLQARRELATDFVVTVNNFRQPLTELRGYSLLPAKITRILGNSGRNDNLQGLAGKLRLAGSLKGLWREDKSAEKEKTAAGTPAAEGPNHAGVNKSQALRPQLWGRISLEGEGLTGPYWTSGRLSAGVELTEGQILVQKISFISSEAEVRLNGYVSFDPVGLAFGRKSSLNLEARIGEVSKLEKYLEQFLPPSLLKRCQQLKLWPLDGELSLATRVNGPLAGFKGRFAFAGKNLRAGIENLASVKAEGQFNREEIEISSISFDKKEGVLGLAGRMRFNWREKAFTAVLEADGQELKDWVSWIRVFSLEGIVGLRLEATGSGPNFDLIYRIDGNNIKIGPRQIPDLPAATRPPSLHSSIFYPLEEPASSFPTREVQPLSPPQASPFLWPNPAFKGFQGEAPALLSFPAVKLSGGLTIKSGNIDFFSLTTDFGQAGFSFSSLFVETLGPLQLTLQDDLLSVSGLNWNSEGLRLQVEGDLGFKSKQGELKAELRFPLALLSKLSADFLSRRRPDEAGRLKVVAGQGELWMQSKIRGALGQPQEIEPAVELQLAEGSLFISGFQANQLTLEKINLQARLNKEALTVSNVSLNLGGAQIAGCGRLPLAGLVSGEPGEAEISLAFWRLDPFDFIASQLDKLPPSLREKFLAGARGEVSGELNLSLVPTPEKWSSTVNGEIKLGTLKLNLRELILANKQPVILHLEPGLIWLKETEITSEAFNLRFGAELRHPFSLLSPQAVLTAFLRVTGGLEALSPWFEAAKLRGQTALSVSLAGPVAKVEPRVTLELRRVSVEFASFPLLLSDISGYFFYSGGRLNFRSFRGLANGGPWEIGGFLETRGAGRLKSAEIQILIKDFPLEVEDMVTAGLDASLHLESVREKLVLSGEIAARKAEVVADISQVSQWLRRRTSFYRRPTATTPSLAPDVGLNIRINFSEPITIVNSFLRTQVGGSLTVSGTLGEPAILGRLTNSKAGEFTWAEKRYRLEKIQVDFTGTFPPDPKLEIVAQTELVHRYEQVEVKLLLSGPVSDLRLSFQSSPPRSQEELAFLLLTGKSIEEMRTEGLGGLREQILLALATPTSSRVGGAMRRLLGVEEVRIEPLGIAGETDPGARLTLVKQITPAARVTTSVDVTNSQRQTWTVDYRLTGGMIFQVFRKDDGSYGAGARHSLSLGKDKEGRKPSQEEAGSPASLTGKRITSVEIEGESFFPAALIQKKLGSLRPGMIFASNRLEAGIKRLVSFYRQHQFLQVMITPQVVAGGEKGVRVILEINAGPKIEIEYRGDSLSRPIRRRVENLWSRETNLEVAARRSANLVEKALRGLGYYQATVNWELKVEEKRVYFPLTVTKSQRYRLGDVKIDAVSQERAARLWRQIKLWRTEDTKGFWLLVIEPRAAAEAAQAWYEEQGFLQAKVEVVTVEERQKRTINILVKVEEGLQSFVRQVRIEGNREVAVSELEARLEIRAGQPFNPSRLMTDRGRLLTFLRHQGYLEAAVTSRVEFSDSSNDVDVFFRIEEGVAHRVAEVEFSGQRKAHTRKLDQIFGLQPGERLSFERLAEGQKALYDLGDFSLVLVMTEPWTEDATLGREKVRVELRREPVLNLRYGLRYDSEAKTEVTAGLDFRHLFGLGRHGLVHFIYNERMRDWRFSFHDRSFLGLKIDSLLSFYFTQKKETGFITDEAGGSWRYQFTLPGKVLFSLLGRRSRIHTYETKPSGPFPFDISLSLTELAIQAVRDFRDDPLDSQRGSFFSSSLTYSPEELGSELTYLSWFGQASFYQPLGSKLVFSSNFRLGLATAFDQVMVPARRFYAGGGYSVRGFKQDRLGPYDPYLEQPEGGEAVFISNQEFRFNLVPGIAGVLFYDAGNVFPEVKDMSLRGLRHSAGIGLRLKSPFGLLRFDLGFNLRPKPGEPRQLFFFTLGQIF